MLTEKEFYILHQNKEMLTHFLKSDYPSLSSLPYYDITIIYCKIYYTIRYYYHNIIYNDDNHYYTDFYGYQFIDYKYNTEIKNIDISIKTDSLKEICKKIKLNVFL